MKIFITGISGTLGRAFTELLNEDHEISGIDRNEEGVARLNRDFAIDVKVGDIEEVDLRGYKLLIHLAAMKHIDLCESSPSACILNNVIKTYNLFKKASEHGVDVLFMSTDKAVEPTSIYGYSKALIEGMCKENGWAFARSGNILLSSGSVLTIWEEAIKNKQPLKITHKDMRRYFITPENLAFRVWNGYLNGQAEIIPKMDIDMKLVDLAADTLAKHGYTIKDYPGGIKYIGLREGEKLIEKLKWGR